MSNEVYSVTLPSSEPIYVSAKGKAAAKRIALKDVEVRRLSGTEVARIIDAGHIIASDEPAEQ